MIHNRLNVDTWNKENISSNPADERNKILESKSPNKLRGELSPLPKLDVVDVKSRQRAKRSTRKTISEIKSFGSGKDEVLCCRFDQDDNLLAAGSSDGLINIYSVNSSGSPLQTLNGAEISGVPITCMRWRPYTSTSKSRQILVTGCGDGNITHWHVPSGKQLHRIVEKDNQVLCLDYDKEGSSFATGGKDKIVRVYDENTKSVKAELSGGFWQFPGHSNRIFALKFHPEDSNILLSAGWDSVVYFWDIRDKHSFASIFGPAISGDALDIKGDQVLTGSWRNKDQLELWDFGSRKKIQGIDWEYGSKIDTAYVYACQFSKKNDDDILAGCSNLNEVKVFDRTANYREYGKISNVDKGVFSVDFASKADTFSFCGGDGRVHIGQLTPA